ncbi:hypothetical protein [Mycolicibacterium fortuitum]|uniref:Uncharacterized protein n=1 Tax=Mycolicibacterium fortuitum TaxID=1766 RepID=A0AAE4VGW7_MYCFO|nr:hypothetical protein [Mycolicibacterium fortuitum]MDV7194773.1 hypothetical protein [Mycolicibacterium fortuitum]MDV7207676.1 hypothetical protein [Mycolicibacterium fortuitum]MDV7229732.1 hypothetical protein [Mycolicibacterium fortuitum]MDV7261515.1 hypothetical protein [Mycolicibacterium fortuitum]MDV7286705.1 hypothetical protein [Mycolicibacterium fortuitum]
MRDLTPERIRDAAEVHHLLNVAANVSDDYGRNVKGLLRLATAMEREAEREKRVYDLAGELLNIHLATRTSGTSGKWWPNFASALLDRYPALAEPAPPADCTCLADKTVSNYCGLHGDPTNPGGDCK